jgi:beta-N-acetylhexosaminidase
MRLSRDPAARRRLVALAAAAAVALVAGLVTGAGSDDEEPSTGSPAAKRERPPRPSLSLRQQVGQLTISSFEGTTVPDWLARRLRAGETAGVILFGANVESPAGLRTLTRSLQRAAGGGALVAADQEGGSIRTVSFAGPQAAPPAQGEPAAVERLARESAAELRGGGVNVNLAPVADVAVGPASVVAGRAFAGDVASQVEASVSGMGAERVAATAKHFPGLGAAGANTDDESVTVDVAEAELEERDLPPFEAAISAGAPLVMLSHALYPALDDERIASQSRAIATGLLRERLGFEGVAVTDSMEAQAVLDRSGVAEAGIRSVEAGADLLLTTGSASWNEVFPRLLARARRDQAFRRRVAEAAGRVLRLKRSLGLRAPAAASSRRSSP